MALSKDDKKWMVENLASKKDVDRIDKKFDRLFNFLDKDVSQVKRRVSFIDRRLEIDTSSL